MGRMAQRTLILAAGVGSGHNSAAHAVEQALATRGGGGEIRRLDVLDTTNEVFNRLYDDAYFTLVAEVPWLVGWGYDNQDPPFKLAPVMRWWEQINTTSTVREIRDFDPDLVICTHFLPARLVSLMIARGHLETQLVVVTTDFDFQGLWLSTPISQMFVAREETRAYLLSLGLPSDRVTTSGIPVRPEFSESLDAADLRARYGLGTERPVVLVSAGAAGGPRTLQVVRQVLELPQDFEVVVVCGRNEDLKAQVEAVVGARPNYHVLGFTQEMPQLMRIASLFVGKPGGLSSSECMAAGLPMVIIDPIPGQEERNANYLLEEGAAVRCNYSTMVGYKVGQLLADPQRLAAMAANAARIGYADAAATVVGDSLALDGPLLWISRDAQRMIQAKANEGTEGSVNQPWERLRTLVDLRTGASMGLVGQSELVTLGGQPGSSELVVTKTQLRSLRWQPEYYTLATAGMWLLGDAESATLGIR